MAVRAGHGEQAGGSYGAAPNRSTAAVDGPVGVRPAVLALPEHQLPVHALARHQPLDPDPHQPDPGPLQPERVVRADRRRGRPPGSRRWPRPGCGDRVIVVKSANRTVRVTVRPATPATRIRLGDPVGQPEHLAQDRLAVVGVAAEGLVGAHALVGVAAEPARRPAPGPATTCVGRCPRPARGGGAPSAAPTARCRVRNGVCATSPTVTRPSRCSSSRVFSPTPYSSPTSSGCRNGVTTVGGHDDHAVGLGATAGQLGHRQRRGHADRAGDALLVVDPWRAAARRSASGVPSRRARAADVEERLVERQHLAPAG